MVAVRYEQTPLEALFWLLPVFPFFCVVKAFSSLRVTAKNNRFNPLVHARHGHGRRDTNSLQLTQLKTSTQPPPTGNILMTLSPSAISYPTTPTIPLTWFIKDDMQGNNNMQQLTTRLGYKPQLGHARLVVELATILHEDKAYISVILQLHHLLVLTISSLYR